MTDDELSATINDRLHRLIATIDIEGASLVDQRSKELATNGTRSSSNKNAPA